MPLRGSSLRTSTISSPELNLSKEMLEEIAQGFMTQAELQRMLRLLKKAIIERAIDVEMQEHLGYTHREARPGGQTNHRNGTRERTVIIDDGPVRIEVPRDRDGSFEPQLIGKHKRRFAGFDQKIITMYARGMQVGRIQAYLAEMYGTRLSSAPSFIGKVTDGVMEEVVAWQRRPLETTYSVLFFDVLPVRGPGSALACSRAIYLAAGILPDGNRGVLGIWAEQRPNVKFWRSVLSELRNRGVRSILVAVVNELTDLKDAIQTVFPETACRAGPCTGSATAC